MDVVIDLINRVEEQEALVVQNVRRPKTRLEALVDEAALRTRTKVAQLQVRRCGSKVTIDLEKSDGSCMITICT